MTSYHISSTFGCRLEKEEKKKPKSRKKKKKSASGNSSSAWKNLLLSMLLWRSALYLDNSTSNRLVTPKKTSHPIIKTSNQTVFIEAASESALFLLYLTSSASFPAILIGKQTAKKSRGRKKKKRQSIILHIE